jgi:hypothetical protein
MPYRRLPNTDNARYKALKTALSKGKELPPFELKYSQSTLNKIQGFLPQFEKAMIEYKKTYAYQVEMNKDYLQALRKAKLYISHFIQVYNMAVLRGKLPANTREFFNLGEDDNKVPALNTEASVIEWGKRIIEGEQKRKMQGLAPITNPTIALVKVRYEKFMDGYKFQKTIQKDNKRTLDKLSELRDKADTIIVDIWNEVEDSFKNEPDDIRREEAARYGVVYVYRKNELKKINFFESRQIKMF